MKTQSNVVTGKASSKLNLIPILVLGAVVKFSWNEVILTGTVDRINATDFIVRSGNSFYGFDADGKSYRGYMGKKPKGPAVLVGQTLYINQLAIKQFA